MPRDCIVKKVWAVLTPYIQMTGWLVLMVSIIFYGKELISKAEAFDERINDNTVAIKKLEAVNEKLDLVIKLLGGNP